MAYGGFVFVPVPGLRKNREWLYGSDQTDDLDNLIDSFHIKAGNHPNLLSAGMKVSMHQRT